jgi:predicted kinase
VVIAGLPGAGKTTHARALETQRPAVRLCADDWLDALSQDLWDETAREQIERLQWELARRLLALGTSVIIEWGTWSRTERDRIREQGRRLGARLELHYLDAADAQLLARVHERGREQPPISQDQLRAWRERFEVPTRDEMQGWDAVELIRPRTRV